MRLRQLILLAALFLFSNFCSSALAQPSIEKVLAEERESGKASPQAVLKVDDSKRTAKKKEAIELVEKYLVDGRVKEGKAVLASQLNRHPKDDNLRFSLGLLQFISSIEKLAQDFHYYGLRDNHGGSFNVPFLRMPLPANPKPHSIDYKKFRQIFETLRASVLEADATLSKISDENVQVPLHFGMIRLDLNNDGVASEEETLWKLYARMSGNSSISLEQSQGFCIKFDRGDVHWLRGYSHLLAALSDFYLAHDAEKLFDCTAHLAFAKVDSPYDFLHHGRKVHKLSRDDIDLLDAIAAIHLIRWEVVEPQRLASTLHHLEEVVAQSKVSWKYIMAEIDDDCEWLPNPEQVGVIPNVRVTAEMVTVWGEVMDDCGKVLAGEILIPFWRGEPDEYGVNLRKVFLEPTTFDLVLWVQGTAAKPYLAKGKMVKGDVWKQLDQVFGNNFPGFAVWFN